MDDQPGTRLGHDWFLPRSVVCANHRIRRRSRAPHPNGGEVNCPRTGASRVNSYSFFAIARVTTSTTRSAASIRNHCATPIFPMVIGTLASHNARPRPRGAGRTANVLVGTWPPGLHRKRGQGPVSYRNAILPCSRYHPCYLQLAYLSGSRKRKSSDAELRTSIRRLL